MDVTDIKLTQEELQLLEDIKKNPQKIEPINAIFRNSENFVIKAFQINPDIIKYIDDDIKNNPYFVLKAIKENPEIISYVDQFYHQFLAVKPRTLGRGYKAIKNYSIIFDILIKKI